MNPRLFQDDYLKNRFSLKNKIDPNRQLTTTLFLHSFILYSVLTILNIFEIKIHLKYSEKTIFLFTSYETFQV